MEWEPSRNPYSQSVMECAPYRQGVMEWEPSRNPYRQQGITKLNNFTSNHSEIKRITTIVRTNVYNPILRQCIIVSWGVFSPLEAAADTGIDQDPSTSDG